MDYSGLMDAQSRQPCWVSWVMRIVCLSLTNKYHTDMLKKNNPVLTRPSKAAILLLR